MHDANVASLVHTTASSRANEGRARIPRRGAVHDPGRDLLHYALAAMMLGHVWRIQDLFSILGAIRFVALASLAATALFLLDTDRRRTLRQLKHPVLTYTLAILALMVLSVPGSLYQSMSLNFIVQDHSKTVLLMVLLAASIRTMRDVESFVLVQLFGAGLYSALILLRFEIGPDGRLDNLLYYDANDLGMLIVCTLPLAVYLLRRGVDWRLKTAAALLLPISIMTIVKTGSRGAFLGFVAVTAYMLFQFRMFSQKTRIGVVAAVLLLLLLAGNEAYWDLIRTLLNPQDDYNWAGNADAGRMEVWKRGIGYMLEHPLLGVGARAFPVAEGTISPLAARQAYGIGLKWSAAHNSFIEIGAELGVPALLCFVLLLVAAFRTCRRLGRGAEGGSGQAALGQALCATLVGYVVAGFFLSQAYAVYMYATYGIILGLAKIAPRESVPTTVPALRPRAHDRGHGRTATGRAGMAGRR